MADLTPGEAKAAFLQTFRATARHKHRYDVFRDFVTMAACSLHNGILFDADREQEYLELINTYGKDDQDRFAMLLGYLIAILDAEPRDVLGPLYMDLEIANKDAGQFFTPSEVSDAMTQITFGDLDARIAERGFITISEPACGAGGMVLSAVKYMIGQNHDPSRKMWVQCIDIDRLAALMCYVQLSLWNVPGEVIVGDTLRWDHREVWYTPAHYLGNWHQKLEAQSKGSENPPGDFDDIQEDGEVTSDDPRSDLKSYETHPLTWKGQDLTVRWCPNWGLDPDYGHLEIITEDRLPHPLSQTGYLSHFTPRADVDEVGGPLAYVIGWLTEIDDGKPVQLSLF